MEIITSKRYLNKIRVFKAEVWMFIVVESTTIIPAVEYCRRSNKTQLYCYKLVEQFYYTATDER